MTHLWNLGKSIVEVDEDLNCLKCEKCNHILIKWRGKSKMTFGPLFDMKCPKCGFKSLKTEEKDVHK